MSKVNEPYYYRKYMRNGDPELAARLWERGSDAVAEHKEPGLAGARMALLGEMLAREAFAQAGTPNEAQLYLIAARHFAYAAHFRPEDGIRAASLCMKAADACGRDEKADKFEHWHKAGTVAEEADSMAFVATSKSWGAGGELRASNVIDLSRPDENYLRRIKELDPANEA